jgi:hypothetical protein
MSGWQLTTLRATKLAGFLHCACGLIGVGTDVRSADHAVAVTGLPPERASSGPAIAADR